jgi:hypothetical protein
MNKFKAHIKIMQCDNFLDEKFTIKCRHVVTDWNSTYSNTVDINEAIKAAL